MFERFVERIPSIEKQLNDYSIASLDEAKRICENYDLDIHRVVLNVQPIAYSDACWAFIVGAAIAIKSNAKDIYQVCTCLGQGLQSFCINGSIADIRKVGIGHGNLAAKLMDEKTRKFAFVAGHESFAAAEGAIGIVNAVNKYRKVPIEVVLVGLGKPAAEIISRYKGFTNVETVYNHKDNSISIIKKEAYSNNKASQILCFGAHSVLEGIAILEYIGVDTVITGNSTSHIKFTDPTVAIYKKNRHMIGEQVYSIASGGGTGRTMHPDNVAAGAASYGMTDTTGKTHCDIQFAGSSSVPAHVEMVGFVGIGNNPLVGATVSVAAEVAKALGIGIEFGKEN